MTLFERPLILAYKERPGHRVRPQRPCKMHHLGLDELLEALFRHLHGTGQDGAGCETGAGSRGRDARH